MATVNYSVPEEVKREFNEAFAAENKSAVVARLMRAAVAEKRRQEGRSFAVQRLLALRQSSPPVTEREIAEARQALRS